MQTTVDAFGGVFWVAFSLDGKQLATVDGDTVRLRNPATGQAHDPPLYATGATLSVTAVAFSPDGTLLAGLIGADGTVRLWDPVTGQPHGAPLQANAGASNAVAFSPDCKLLATAGTEGTVRLWNLASGQSHSTTQRAGGGITGVNDIAFTPGGKLLATAGSGTVRLWNPATGQPISAPLQASTSGPSTVNGVAFSPDGKLLASADGDGTVRLWEVCLFAHPYSALCADVGPPIQQEPTQQETNQYVLSRPKPQAC